MTMVDEPTARPASRAMELIRDSGVRVRPSVAASIERMHFGGHNYLVIDEDDAYLLDTEMAVFGAMLDAEGVLHVVPLGEVRAR